MELGGEGFSLAEIIENNKRNIFGGSELIKVKPEIPAIAKHFGVISETNHNLNGLSPETVSLLEASTSVLGEPLAAFRGNTD